MSTTSALGERGEKQKKTDSNHSSPIAPNLLERDFTADAPNKKWMMDMTFIATSEGWLYLAGVIDAYSRRVVGWAMGQEHDAELVKQALQMAFIGRQPGAGLVLAQAEAVSMQARAIKKCCISILFR